MGLAVEKGKPVFSLTLLPRQLPPPSLPPFLPLVSSFFTPNSVHPLHSFQGSVHPAPSSQLLSVSVFSGPMDLMQSCWLVVRMWPLALWALGSFWLWLARWLLVWYT